MAERPRGYGLTAELAEKMSDKYYDDLEQQARLWMEAVLQESLDENVPSSEPFGLDRFHATLKDGRLLCKLVNKLMGSKGNLTVNTSKMAFKQMENIGNFLGACISYGVKQTDCFQTVDLYEKVNMCAVVNMIHALGRKAQVKGFDGPQLGPKELTVDRSMIMSDGARNDEIGLQMGTNKGASQAGVSPYGLGRQIEKTSLQQ